MKTNNQQIKNYKIFINENWDTIKQIFDKGIQEYFESINLLNIECLRCLNYSNKVCGGWNWKEDPFTHKCINFKNIG